MRPQRRGHAIRRGTAPPRTVIAPPRQGGAAQSCSARAVCSRPSFVRASGVARRQCSGCRARGDRSRRRPERRSRIAPRFSFIGSAGPTTDLQQLGRRRRRAGAVARRADAAARRSPAAASRIAQPTQCFVDGGRLPLAAAATAATAKRSRSARRCALGAAASCTAAKPCSSSSSTRIAIATPPPSTASSSTVTAAGGDRETHRARGDGGRLGPLRGLRADARDAPRPPATACCRCSATPSSRRSYADPLDATDTATRRGARRSVRPRVRLADRCARRTALACGSSSRAPARRPACSATTASAPTPPSSSRASPSPMRGGTVYSFPPGVFRFPLVATGDYRLVVEPPSATGAVDRDRSALADVARRAVCALARHRSAARSRSRGRSRRPSTFRSTRPRARSVLARPRCSTSPRSATSSRTP